MAQVEEEAGRCATPTEDNPSAPRPNSSGRRSGSKRNNIPSGCTVPKPFPLATGRRIEERHRYDEELQRRQDAAEERDRELEEEREREEKQKLKEYRKTLVIKAQPIGRYSGIAISPSSKELTVPESPKLSAISRNRNRVRLPSDGSTASSDSPQDHSCGSGGDSRVSTASSDSPRYRPSHNGQGGDNHFEKIL